MEGSSLSTAQSNTTASTAQFGAHTESIAYRTLSLLSYTPSPLFPAHWSLWVPNLGGTEGTRLHVTGDTRNGFIHEFERNYNPNEDGRRPWMKAVAKIGDR